MDDVTLLAVQSYLFFFWVLLGAGVIGVALMMLREFVPVGIHALLKRLFPRWQRLRRGERKPLEIKVETVDRDIDGTSHRVFSVTLEGSFSTPHTDWPCRTFLHLFDVERGVERPVLCGIPALREEGSAVFELRSEEFKLPGLHAALEKPLGLAHIPLAALQLARRGRRRLRFRVHQVAGPNVPRFQAGFPVTWPSGSVTAVASADIEFDAEVPGYDEHRDANYRAEEMSVRLAMAMSAVDGDLDQREGWAIRRWLAERATIARNDDEGRQWHKARYNAYLAQAFADQAAARLSVDDSLAQLRDCAEADSRYDAMELCMQVAAADGAVAAEELALLDTLAQRLELDAERVRAMRDRLLPVALHTGQLDDERLLGVTATMTDEEVRRHLNNEYRKWNGRVTHVNPAVRQQAEQMLLLIAACRERRLASATPASS